jgi:predicted PurR-regulated permease PerM
MIYNNMVEIIITLGLMVVILGYTTINLLFKTEKLEDIIENQQNYINSISKIIKKSEKKLKEIDRNETFKSDDEIGWFFNEIKNIQNILSNYKN